MAMADSVRGRQSRMDQAQMVEPLEGRVLLSSAALDPGFGVTSEGVLSNPQVLGVQADGKILVAGKESGMGWTVLRYNANGRIDQSFGNKGMAVVSGLVTMESSGVLAVQVQSNGKIILGGTVYDPGAQRYVLVRLLANGQMDQGFGSQGIVQTPMVTYGYFGVHMEIGLQGKRIVVGATHQGDFAVMSYTDRGLPYKKFGKRGFTAVDFGGEDSLGAMALDSQGKVIVGGRALNTGGQWDFALARLAANGKLDPSFHKDGKLTTNLGSNEWISSIGVQTNGRITVAGAKETAPNSGQYSGVLVRYKATGKGDATFGTKGITGMGGYVEDENIVFEKSGGILVTELEGRSLQVSRFAPNGRVDEAFGTHGRQGLSLGGKATWDVLKDTAQGSDGQVLVMLQRETATEVPFRLVRYGIV